MKKRWLSLLLALTLLFSVLPGCASKDEPEPSAAPTAESAAPDAAETEMPDFDPDTVTPAMWRVTDGAGHTLYLFGTIHVGDARNEIALEKIAPTLDACDALAVEFDIVAYEGDVQAQMDTLTQFVSTDGTTVDEVMPEDLFERAKALLQDAGVYSNALKRYNLQFWSVLVEQAVMLVCSALDSEQAMDSKLIARAYDCDQTVLSVESAELQYSIMANAPDELCLLLISETLDAADDYGDDLMEMYQLWLSGDADALAAFIETEDEPDADDYTPEQIAMIEAYNRALTDERNDGMLLKAQEYLASGDTVFFAVGAAHMLGTHGLVQLLQNAGYTVERFDYAA